MKNRRSVRRSGHDYTARCTYLVTICTRNRQSLLGRIAGLRAILSAMGQAMAAEWRGLPNRFPDIGIGEFVVMPNHIHAIITVGARAGSTRTERAEVRAGASPAPATLGHVVGAFKSLSDRRCRQLFTMSNPGRRFGRLWQRNFHECAVHDRETLDKIRAYIRNNPAGNRGRGVRAPEECP